MRNSKWKAFEKDIHAIHAQFASEGTQVTHDLKVVGFESKVDRQIDVAIRTTVSDYPIFIAIECKDKNKPIDVQEVSEFAIKVKDIQANRGVMISTSGYTAAANNMARAYGVDTLTFGETTDLQLGELSTFCVTCTKKDIRWRVAGFLLDNELRKTQMVLSHHSTIYRQDGSEIGTISSQVEQRMNSGLVPGIQGNHLVDFGSVFLMLGEELRPALVQVEVVVAVRYFLGHFPFLQTTISDAQTGKVVRNLIRTPHISIKPWEIPQPEWARVESIKHLAITPSMQFMEGPAWAFR